MPSPVQEVLESAEFADAAGYDWAVPARRDQDDGNLSVHQPPGLFPGGQRHLRSGNRRPGHVSGSGYQSDLQQEEDSNFLGLEQAAHSLRQHAPRQKHRKHHGRFPFPSQRENRCIKHY